MLFSYRKKPAFEIPVGCLRTCTNDTAGLTALRSCDAIEQLPFRPLRITPQGIDRNFLTKGRFAPKAVPARHFAGSA